MTLDMTTFDAMLKDIYAPGAVENIGYDGNAAFAIIKKRRGKLIGGRKWIQPVGTRLTNRGSQTFSVANGATANESKHDAFEVLRAHHYRVAKLDNETIEATGENQEAFEPALDEIDKCIKAESNWANFRFYRSKGGSIGRMTNTAFATTVMTVDDPAALWAVSQGDVVTLSAADGNSGALRAGTLTVASVQHPAPGGVGTITFTGNISAGVAAAAANDFLFLEGDFGFTQGFSPAGLADYVPDNAADAATTLFGFDRSVSNLLGGARVDGTSMSISELIIDMIAAHTSYAGEYSSGTKTLFAHPFTLGNLQKQLDGKWVIMQSSSYDGTKNASIGVNAFQLDHMGIKTNIVQDRMCPVKRLYMIDLDAWTMFHAGMFPGFLTKKHGTMLKPSETADAWELRTGGYLNYVTKSPQCNVVGLVA